MPTAREVNNAGFLFVDWIILIFVLAWEFLLKTCNSLGFAWWAKVETSQPETTYYFGPFFSKVALKKNLKGFLIDISKEKPSSVNYKIIRSSYNEPLTIIENLKDLSLNGTTENSNTIRNIKSSNFEKSISTNNNTFFHRDIKSPEQKDSSFQISPDIKKNIFNFKNVFSFVLSFFALLAGLSILRSFEEPTKIEKYEQTR